MHEMEMRCFRSYSLPYLSKPRLCRKEDFTLHVQHSLNAKMTSVCYLRNYRVNINVSKISSELM